MAITKRTVNYLNNKDILKEIHTSKNSYCAFSKKEYHRYDLIIDKPEATLEMSLAFASKPGQIRQAKEVRAARLSVETGEKVNPKSIKNTDLIFRVMTWEHVPVAQKLPRKIIKKKTAKDIAEFYNMNLEDDFEAV